MAALSVTNPTLLDLAKRSDPGGKIEAITELLMETNEVLDEMSWMDGNLTTGHRTTIRTGIPAPTWRKINEGIQPAKSTTAQITHNTGMLEALAEVDKALADLNGNTAAFRMSEDRAFIEGMNQEIVETLFYGNEGTEPEAFTGLSTYYNDLSAANADNILVGGGAGVDNASIWLVVWGPNTVHGIVPKGSTAGLQVRDLGETVIEDVTGSGGGRMLAYRTHYRWDAGLALRDWRYVVRIPNIDKSLLTRSFTASTKDFATGANLPDLMFQAMRLVPNLNAGRPSWYMSRDTATWLARQKASLGLDSYAESETVAGDRRWTETFMGIPVRRVDALSADEALVV
jgi:hypothetical protein